MNTKLILFLSFLVAGFFATAQELVIEVTTDKYPAETSWKLFDTDKNVIKTNGILVKNTTYRDTIQLEASKCYYWTIYDTYGNGMSNGTPAGDYKIYYKGALFAEAADPNFGDSISVYGLGENCAEFDASVESLNFSATQAFNPFGLTFTVLNYGSQIINSLNVIYSIDGNPSETISLGGLNIEFGTDSILKLPNDIQILIAGNHEIELEITQLNGVEDGFTTNNKKSKTFEVKDGYRKKPMHEVFTSSTCDPCVAGNIAIDRTLVEYNPNQYSLVKYQMNWPGSGDPYYTNEGGYMKGQYNVSSVPSLYVNFYGHTPASYSPEILDPYLVQLSDFGIEMSGEVIGDSIFVSATISAAKNAKSDVFIRLSVVEKITYDNVTTNGEKEFHNVFMKFLSAKTGDNIGTLRANDIKTVTYKAGLLETNIEEMDDLRIVMYLFNNNTYAMLQSDMVDVPFFYAPPVITSNIANGAVNVSTASPVEFYTNQLLYDKNGSQITDFTNYINFLEADETPVNFTVLLSVDKKTITVTPNANLGKNTVYHVKLDSVYSDKNVGTVTTLSFTTDNGVNVISNEYNYTNLYPNPVNELFYFNAFTNGKITITDITGKVILVQPVLKGLNTLSAAEFKLGMYIVQFSDGTSTAQFKIQKLNY